MVHQKLGEDAVEFNCRVLHINFRVTYPGQVNNRETVRRTSVAEQYVIAALGITERLHWQAIKQMPTGQLALKLCFKTLRHAGIGPLPSLRETVNISRHHFTPNGPQQRPHATGVIDKQDGLEGSAACGG